MERITYEAVQVKFCKFHLGKSVLNFSPFLNTASIVIKRIYNYYNIFDFSVCLLYWEILAQ